MFSAKTFLLHKNFLGSNAPALSTYFCLYQVGFVGFFFPFFVWVPVHDWLLLAESAAFLVVSTAPSYLTMACGASLFPTSMVFLVSLAMVPIFLACTWLMALFIAVLNSSGMFFILRVQLSSQWFPIMWVAS